MDKLPPQNLEAEQSVLGALLLDKDAIIKVADIILPDDFYKEDHSLIYETDLELYEKRVPIDMITLTDALTKKKKLKQIGGAAYLATLVNCVSSTAHIVQHAQIMHQKAVLRRLISAAAEITEMGFEEQKGESIEEILDQAEQKLFAVSQKFIKQYFTPIRDILSTSFDRIDEIHKHKGKLRGVATGFEGLDNLLSGFQASDLVIIAARPSMGKSSLALNIAANAAIHTKTPVGIFSLEMSKDQIVDRFLCSVSGVDSWKLRTGNLDDDDFPKINYAMGILSEAPIYIDDSGLINVMEIRTKARRLQSESGLGLLIIDYLQLMESKGYVESRVQEISQISRQLKALARELNIPILAISQLSRAVEARPDHRPQLADLRESGSIEQDADVVIFIYRDDYYNKDNSRKNIADILIRKHRNGPTGDLELYFKGECMKFLNIEKKHGEEGGKKKR